VFTTRWPTPQFCGFEQVGAEFRDGSRRSPGPALGDGRPMLLEHIPARCSGPPRLTHRQEPLAFAHHAYLAAVRVEVAVNFWESACSKAAGLFRDAEGPDVAVAASGRLEVHLPTMSAPGCKSGRSLGRCHRWRHPRRTLGLVLPWCGPS